MIKKLPQEQKLALIAQVQQYFQMERGEEIGDLAAESMLEFMVSTIGPLVYNEALKDARSIINERILSLEDELYTLEKPLKLSPRY
ncbi:MAG: hypothetical protein JWM44_2336 [Bacilli bacterium]|jgi:uncharacterized protein (DUF2164 family)|nr:hypothetical protein [Bacilli bacterium]